MAFSVSGFKSNLSAQSGGARPALYEVDINHFTGDSSFSTNQNILVKAASIPPATIAPLAVNYAGRAYKWNGFRTYDNWTVTVINDEDFGIRIALEQWMDLIADHRLNIRRELNKNEGENANYKQRIKLTQWTKSGEEAWHYHFIGAFPTALSAIALDWGTASEIEEYTCTWSFDRWMPGTTGHLLVSDSHNN